MYQLLVMQVLINTTLWHKLLLLMALIDTYACIIGCRLLKLLNNVLITCAECIIDAVAMSIHIN